MRATETREAAHRLARAPARRHLGPLCGALVVAAVATRQDRTAVDDPGSVEAERPAHRLRDRLVDQRLPGVEPALGHRDVPEIVLAERFHVAVVLPARDRARRLEVQAGGREVATLHRGARQAPLEVAVLCPLFFLLEQRARAQHTADRDAQVRVRVLLDRGVQGHARRADAVVAQQIACFGTLQDADHLAEPAGPARRLGEHLEVFRGHLLRSVGRCKQAVRVVPLPALVRVARRRQIVARQRGRNRDLPRHGSAFAPARGQVNPRPPSNERSGRRSRRALARSQRATDPTRRTPRRQRSLASAGCDSVRCAWRRSRRPPPA